MRVCVRKRSVGKTTRSRAADHVLRRGVSLALIVAAPLFTSPAEAADGFFSRMLSFVGLGEAPPAPSASALPYDLKIVAGGNSRIEQAVRDVSALYRLRLDAPPDAEALALRASGDVGRIVDALWGAGYYGARVTVEVAGAPLQVANSSIEQAVRAAEAYRGRALAPVRILVEPGPLFQLRSIRVVDASSGAPFEPGILPPRIVGLAPGDPARAADVLAAQTRIVDHFRRASRPFAKVVRVDSVVDHPVAAVDLVMIVSPGRVIPLGEVSVRASPGIDARVIRSFVYVEPGEPYSPEALASIRRSISQIEAVSSVRITAPDGPAGLDALGRLPLVIETGERPPRAFGLSARYSTRDGPVVAGRFTHRNLFGGAERLRIEASANYLTDSGPVVLDDKSWTGKIGGRVSASFIKPALAGSRFDLLADATLLREVTEGYVSQSAGAAIGFRRRFAERFSAQARLQVETGESRDALGVVDYTLVGLPASVTYDSTDRPLDPTRGVRIRGEVAPFLEPLGSTVGFTRMHVAASAYRALDEGSRIVLAGRAGLGSITGAGLASIPANYRFYAGGGGSVRGYAYKSLSPTFLGEPIGGLSLLEGSLEARVKITDTIGLVPFIDGGMAFTSSFPDFDEPIRFGAGLGLRYYTSLGPVRLDVAIPLNRRSGEPGFAFYIGFGEAF